MRVKIGPSTGCWEWQGSKDDGYGRLSLFGRHFLVHRLIYAIFYGMPGDKEVVRHRCDNPSCINPLHLELGSHADNMADRAKRTGVSTRKLNPQEVDAIREAVLPYKHLAQRYGVSEATISNVKRRKTYKHW